MNTMNTNLPPIGLTSADHLTTAAKSTKKEIQQVGEDFESIFMSLMLKEMRNSLGVDEEGGLFAGEGSDTYGGLFDMFMGQHLAKSGALGIGQAVETYLSNQVHE